MNDNRITKDIVLEILTNLLTSKEYDSMDVQLDSLSVTKKKLTISIMAMQPMTRAGYKSTSTSFTLSYRIDTMTLEPYDLLSKNKINYYRNFDKSYKEFDIDRKTFNTIFNPYGSELMKQAEKDNQFLENYILDIYGEIIDKKISNVRGE